MRIWYDWEFLEDGKTILPISVGMVREDGRTLYAVNDQLLRPPTRLTVPPDHPYARVCASDWLMRNVIPHLPLKSRDGHELTHKTQSPTGPAFFSLDPEHPAVLPLRLIRAQVREFVLGAENPELWSWCASYDHLVLCQLFGKMIDLPRGFPMHTNDVVTLATLTGGRRPDEPPQEGAVHDALADAWHHQRLWAFYAERLAEATAKLARKAFAAEREGNWPVDEQPTIPVFEVP